MGPLNICRVQYVNHLFLYRGKVPRPSFKPAFLNSYSSVSGYVLKMSMLFRRPSSVTCFFCLSLAGPTSNVHNFDPTFFRCPACGCLNRYDEKGRIINEEPAMYNERLNSVSFSKRGEHFVVLVPDSQLKHITFT